MRATTNAACIIFQIFALLLGRKIAISGRQSILLEVQRMEASIIHAFSIEAIGLPERKPEGAVLIQKC